MHHKEKVESWTETSIHSTLHS